MKVYSFLRDGRRVSEKVLNKYYIVRPFCGKIWVVTANKWTNGRRIKKDRKLISFCKNIFDLAVIYIQQLFLRVSSKDFL